MFLDWGYEWTDTKIYSYDLMQKLIYYSFVSKLWTELWETKIKEIIYSDISIDKIKKCLIFYLFSFDYRIAWQMLTYLIPGLYLPPEVDYEL